ncbi:hypothetical protein [Chryseobacterium sp. JV274]|uniref:hypothetical protein n=1 Tax=Chryseobacterium sp. JV274 TaxID=1932669 RepID=UPI0009840E1C|nr:hypothetical protein [Chryseobacterium sp. JV274]
MKATDLRINNMVFGPDAETICLVKYIDGEEDSISTDKYSEMPTNEYYHICLNEQWLLNFGFEKEEDYTINYHSDGDVYVLDEIYLSFIDSKCWLMKLEMEYRVWTRRELNGVHDLQNLFFALKEKELTLK